MIYLICLLILLYGFKKVKILSDSNTTPALHFSIIIPFRNESSNLPFLLESIQALNYPREMFEIIFINDESDDNSEKIIRKSINTNDFSIQLIQNKRSSNSPKKDAISEGIKHAQFNWIITTDADCTFTANWLKTLDSFISSVSHKINPMMICGPVLYISDGSFLKEFQQLDGLSLQAVTMGSFGLDHPILCNGANMAYRKNAFVEVQGFSGNDHLASGDDIFLMEKFKTAFPNQVLFLKSRNAVVFTKPQPSWKSVILQRIRWASKTSQQKNIFSQTLGIVVLIVNIIFLILPILVFLDYKNSFPYLILLLLKTLADYFLVRKTVAFFNLNPNFFKFLYFPYIYSGIIILVLFGSFKGNYSWKDRQY